MKKRLVLLMALAACTINSYAQAERIRLYEGKAPGSENWNQQEFKFDYDSPMYKGEVNQVILNVVDPELYAFLPAKGTETRAAVVVCPGGGFTALSWDTEGPNVARWLAQHGIAAYVLKYRIAFSGANLEEATYVAEHTYGGKGRDEKLKTLTTTHAEIAKQQGYDRQLSCDDGRAAVSYLRKNADKLGIDPKKIGIIGFSAGGFLALDVAINHDELSRPDFVGVIYGAYFDATTPTDPMPLFMAASQQEIAGNASALYGAWCKTRQPAEVHSFTNAFHGFGYRDNGRPENLWITLFYNFLAKSNLL